MKKRLLAMLLAVVMVCALLPMAALAATVTQVVPCKYDEVKDFSGGFAAVKLNGKWGFIDTTGKEVISPKYDVAYNFSGGLAWVRIGDDISGKLGFIDGTGKEVVPFGKYYAARDFSEGLAAVRVGNSSYFGKWGFIDTTGQEVIPCQYDEVRNFREGLAAVKLDDKWGYIDQTGKEIVPFGKYDRVSYFSDGLAAVKLNGKWGFIDTTGKEVVPCQYGDVNMFSEGLAAVERSIGVKDEVGRPQYRVGYIDKTGREVIPCKYYHVLHSFHDGLAVVIVPDGPEDGRHYKYGVIDKTGKEVISFQYHGIKDFSEGFAVVFRKETGRYGFVDATGKEILAPTKYWDMTDFSGGLAKVGVKVRIFGEVDDLMPDEWEWGYVNTAGEEVVPLGKYTDLSKKASEGLFKVYSFGVGYGMVDVTGEEVVPCKYDGMSDFSEGLAAVKLGRKWGFISLDPNAVAYTPGVEPDSVPAETPAPAPAAYTASPTNDKLTVDGGAATPTAYKISGSNYFKLRDVAALLNGSAKQFDVGYDSASKSVTITTGKGYAAQSGDLQPAPAGKAEATVSNNAVYIDGVKVELTVYKINGNNYFMLRDLGQKLGFNVGWESGRGMFIETDKEYDPSN